MASLATMRVENLRETIKGLKAINDQLPKEIKVRAKEAGDRMIPEAQAFYRGHYEQHTGKHAARMRTLATLRGDVKIVAGGKKFPEMGGQEFGSDKWPQFSPKAPASEGSSGRFLWRAAVEGLEEFTESISETLVDVMRKAGFKNAGIV